MAHNNDSYSTKNTLNDNNHSNDCNEVCVPLAIMGRTMRKRRAKNEKESREAQEVVQQCVTQFISFITWVARHRCMENKRKTMNADDLLRALQVSGFTDYIFPLRRYLEKYRAWEERKQADPPQGHAGSTSESGVVFSHVQDGTTNLVGLNFSTNHWTTFLRLEFPSLKSFQFVFLSYGLIWEFFKFIYCIWESWAKSIWYVFLCVHQFYIFCRKGFFLNSCIDLKKKIYVLHWTAEVEKHQFYIYFFLCW